MILLDTNVISELMRPKPDPGVLAWADGLDPEAVAITAMLKPSGIRSSSTLT